MALDPTRAKELVIGFLKRTNQIPTPALMRKITYQIKELMMDGFTVDEIEYAINYALERSPNVYSFGYIETCINDAVRIKKDYEKKELIARNKKAIEHIQKEMYKITENSEVVSASESSQRNREKAERVAVQSTSKKKTYYELFE